MPGFGSLTPAATMLGMMPGAGNQLEQQRKDQTEEELKKRKLGLSNASPALLQLFGMRGVGVATP